MRDQFSRSKPGDNLSADHVNRVGRVASQLSAGVPGPFAHGTRNAAFSADSPPAPWVETLIEITDDSDKILGHYQGRLVGYVESTGEWEITGNEYLIDASGYDKDGEDWLVTLSKEVRYPCYWDSQRGAFIPICCGTSPSFECVIYKDYFDFYPGPGFPNVADPSFYDDLNTPGSDEWFVINEHWRRQQRLITVFNPQGQFEDVIAGVEVNEFIQPIRNFQYHGYAEAINAEAPGQDPDIPDSGRTVLDSQPWAVVRQHHPQGIPDTVISAQIVLRSSRVQFPTHKADRARIFLGYRGPPYDDDEEDLGEAGVDYYYAEVIAGNRNDPEFAPGVLRLGHQSREIVDNEGTVIREAEDIVLAQIESTSLLLDIKNAETFNRTDREIFVDLCYFGGWLTATLDRARSASEGAEPRPGTGVASVSIQIPRPIGDRVGMKVECMRRDSVADNDEFPILYRAFEWWHHRLEPLDVGGECEFCLADCGVCEVDETPVAYMITIEGVTRNSGGGPNDDAVEQVDQCITCDEMNAVYIAHITSLNVESSGDIQLDRGCCYQVAIGCEEMQDPCPEDPGTGEPFCTSVLCFMRFCIENSGGFGSGSIRATLTVYADFKSPDEGGTGAVDDCIAVEATIGFGQDAPVVAGIPTLAIPPAPGVQPTCRNSRFEALLGQTSLRFRGPGAQQCKWTAASFAATPLYKEDFEDDVLPGLDA